jgi:hypothetical protein
VLFLIHCDRLFLGPTYEAILALVRNVRNGSIMPVWLCRSQFRLSPKSRSVYNTAIHG